MKKILLIEDDSALLDALCEILEGAGYCVIPAPSSEDGLLALAESVPDLVISDVSLPGMDGFALYDSVKRSQPDLRFIFITAGSHIPEAKIKAVIEEGHAYLRKPFNIELFLHTVSDLIALSRLTRSGG